MEICYDNLKRLELLLNDLSMINELIDKYKRIFDENSIRYKMLIDFRNKYYVIIDKRHIILQLRYRNIDIVLDYNNKITGVEFAQAGRKTDIILDTKELTNNTIYILLTKVKLIHYNYKQYEYYINTYINNEVNNILGII